ncbi:MAG: hypothetical protein ACLUPE_13705, partial [Turicibacter sanguinis]|uniref:hypothetical protein n=1 Tax=Turicibacter sanguinis TaxID=154288 RepID=UPI003992A44D
QGLIALVKTTRLTGGFYFTNAWYSISIIGIPFNIFSKHCLAQLRLIHSSYFNFAPNSFEIAKL